MNLYNDDDNDINTFIFKNIIVLYYISIVKSINRD